jgi:DNA-binding CsgD family transcriptional regulator
VLSHVAYGLSNDEIAQLLEISVETVKGHVQNMLL